MAMLKILYECYGHASKVHVSELAAASIGMCLTGIAATEVTFWSGDLVELRPGLIGKGDYFENGFLGLKINMHFGPGFRGGGGYDIDVVFVSK